MDSASFSLFLHAFGNIHFVMKGSSLKVHEIILNFFCDLNQNLIRSRSIFKKFDSFPSVFARISMFEQFFGDWTYAEPNFFGELSKKFCSQNFLGPFRWVPKQFFKISIIYSQNLHFKLVFLSKLRKLWACICWAYVETILSHTDHTRKRFHRTLIIRGTNFRACSASGKMWIVFTCTSMLNIRGTNFIAQWAYAKMFKSRISRPNLIQFSKISCYRTLGP